MTTQPPTTALQFGRTNKPRLLADIAGEFADRMWQQALDQAIEDMENPVIINAEDQPDMSLPFTEDLN